MKIFGIIERIFRPLTFVKVKHFCWYQNRQKVLLILPQKSRSNKGVQNVATLSESCPATWVSFGEFQLLLFFLTLFIRHLHALPLLCKTLHGLKYTNYFLSTFHQVCLPIPSITTRLYFQLSNMKHLINCRYDALMKTRTAEKLQYMLIAHLKIILRTKELLAKSKSCLSLTFNAYNFP